VATIAGTQPGAETSRPPQDIAADDTADAADMDKPDVAKPDLAKPSGKKDSDKGEGGASGVHGHA
jgi:hypothetical protein